MKINELLTNIHRDNFDIAKELKVKTYLPIEEKKVIAKGIIYECTEYVDGVYKLDSVQQYLSYVKYMLLKHTNLEYTDGDYDKLCSTEYGDDTLLGAIIECFGADAKECSRILNLMLDDKMRENSIDASLGKFFNGLGESLNEMAEVFKDKVDGFDMKSIIPEDLDANKLSTFLNTYVK